MLSEYAQRHIRRLTRAVVGAFVTVLVAELRDRANRIAESVERTGTTSDFDVAQMLMTVAVSVEAAGQTFEEAGRNEG